MTEIFMVLSQPHPYVIPQKIGRIFPPIKEFLRYWKSIARSSLVGLVTGIIPGAGANVATFVSYGIGERFSGRRFSKGDMEGVICSEVANNANIGGALLPSLVLGIPGSATTAAFLAALNLHGIVVGPTIELEQPGIMYFMYGTLIVANIGMFLCAFAMIKPSVKLFSLPREILLPIIALLCVLGAFAQKLSLFDIYLMFGFGILGLCMRKVDIPIGPMVLGVILGNMLDQNFRRAMYIFEDKSLWQILIERPLGTFLIAVVLITFINGIWPKKNKRKA
jgi:putative tricarboxylic transport membrane protein